MNKPRVFAVQQPTGRSATDGAVRQTMDLSPALEYGALHYILNETENPFRNISATARRAHNYLMERGFGPEDFVLLVGNPILIAVVAAVAANISGSLKLLQWSRTEHTYRPVTVQLPAVATREDRG